MRLIPIPAERYAEQVLPLTAALWAGSRVFQTYLANTIEVAQSPYGKRNYRTFGLAQGDEVVASFKRYERNIHFRKSLLRSFGIGAVFTPPEHRGSGYASAMLAMMLDDARKSGGDLAYLYSDIHPAFYRALGFVELPSRLISIRADALPAARISADSLAEKDWPGVRRCFDALESTREWGFERTPIVWDWIRMRIRHGSEHASGQPVNLVLRRGRSVCAYVLGQREPRHDAFTIDEYGFIDDGAGLQIPALLRCAAGDLHRITGWLPPDGARERLPRGSVRKRKDAIFMAAPLSRKGKLLVEHAAAASPSDGVWSSDHI
ncbi:MAG: GNAT family N-acetyltransferase [Candidatus Baltobacteraceae bacterium]